MVKNSVMHPIKQGIFKLEPARCFLTKMVIKLRWCHIVKRLMREVAVIVVDPFVNGELEVERVVPIVAPDDVFFDGPHDAFGIGVTFRV